MKDLETDLKQESLLVNRAKNDPQAFGELYDKYYPQIFGYVLKRTINFEVAQDVTSEVFFKALKNIAKFRWQGVPFSSWLYRIATNEITNSFKGDSRRKILIEQFSASVSQYSPSPDVEIARAEEELKKHSEFIALNEAIAKLPLKYQEVITFRFFEKKQLKEIGEILDKKEGTIKSLLHRGLEKLRTLTEQNATFYQDFSSIK
ncbi:MAG: RNA polymerase sigma factor [Dehalococcoidia bacterium]|nr:MAG: RNA polymerase sigma factor [Dehalococcoidia bacterium]